MEETQATGVVRPLLISARPSLSPTELEEFGRLHKLALEVFEKFIDIALSQERSRSAQLRLVGTIESFLKEKGYSSGLSFDALTKIVDLGDKDFRTLWTGSCQDIAWLLVHEGFSRSFPSFAQEILGANLFLLHQVPKTGTTAVNYALERSRIYAIFSHSSFDFMTVMYGLMGFSLQCYNFRGRHKRGFPLIFGGHYNLPNAVKKYIHSYDVPGITAAVPPEAILSSALRYIWERLAKRVPEATQSYPHVDLDELTYAFNDIIQLTRRLTPGDYRKIIQTILLAPKFIDEYNEVLVRYYCNENVRTDRDVKEFFREFRQIRVAATVQEQLSVIGDIFGRKVTATKENTSSITHDYLERAVGGEEALKQLLSAHCVRSKGIYECLMEIWGAQQ